jgi:hypothetical protein
MPLLERIFIRDIAGSFHSVTSWKFIVRRLPRNLRLSAGPPLSRASMAKTCHHYPRSATHEQRENNAVCSQPIDDAYFWRTTVEPECVVEDPAWRQ